MFSHEQMVSQTDAANGVSEALLKRLQPANKAEESWKEWASFLVCEVRDMPTELSSCFRLEVMCLVEKYRNVAQRRMQQHSSVAPLEDNVLPPDLERGIRAYAQVGPPIAAPAAPPAATLQPQVYQGALPHQPMTLAQVQAVMAQAQTAVLHNQPAHVARSMPPPTPAHVYPLTSTPALQPSTCTQQTTTTNTHTIDFQNLSLPSTSFLEGLTAPGTPRTSFNHSMLQTTPSKERKEKKMM